MVRKICRDNASVRAVVSYTNILVKFLTMKLFFLPLFSQKFVMIIFIAEDYFGQSNATGLQFLNKQNKIDHLIAFFFFRLLMI